MEPLAEMLVRVASFVEVMLGELVAEHNVCAETVPAITDNAIIRNIAVLLMYFVLS